MQYKELKYSLCSVIIFIHKNIFYSCTQYMQFSKRKLITTDFSQVLLKLLHSELDSKLHYITSSNWTKSTELHSVQPATKEWLFVWSHRYYNSIIRFGIPSWCSPSLSTSQVDSTNTRHRMLQNEGKSTLFIPKDKEKTVMENKAP